MNRYVRNCRNMDDISIRDKVHAMQVFVIGGKAGIFVFLNELNEYCALHTYMPEYRCIMVDRKSDSSHHDKCEDTRHNKLARRIFSF